MDENSGARHSHFGQRFQWVFRQFYLRLLKKNMQPEMARLTLARKIAAIALKICSSPGGSGEVFFLDIPFHTTRQP